MEETLRLQLLSLFDAYKKATNTPHSVTGRNAVRDHSIYARLLSRTGSFTVSTYDRLVEWFAAEWPPEVAWPSGISRPASTEVAA